MVNQMETGLFICKCRKEKQLTQAQLAEKLNITDRAVSKWETGKSLPDSAIMLELCDVLGITADELLSGKREIREALEEKTEESPAAPKGKGRKRVNGRQILGIIFSALLLTAILVCFICNLAISGRLTWSWIPMSSILFGWAVCLPYVRFGRDGIVGSFVCLSVFIIPYLYVLSRLLYVREVFTIGGAMAVVSIAFLWMIIAVFRVIGSGRRPIAFGISYLLGIVFVVTVNMVLSRMIAGTMFNVWDGATVFLLLILAGISFARGAGVSRENGKVNLDSEK